MGVFQTGRKDLQCHCPCENEVTGKRMIQEKDIKDNIEPTSMALPLTASF